MKPHILLAHQIWQQHLQPTDTVIDATLGNGYDTLFLSPLVKHIYALDIQESAIESAKKRLAAYSNITFIHGCHSTLPAVSPSLIVYNLGYLPGGDKTITTLTETTLKSLESAKEVLKEGGLISITLYPGHAEGDIEAKALLAMQHPGFESTLHSPLERASAPKLLLLRRSFVL